MANNEEIYEFLNGLDDAGNAINFTLEQNDGSLGAAFESIIYPVEVSLNVKEGHDIQVFISLDGGVPFPVGIAKRGLNRLPIDVNPRTDDYARCRLIKVVLREFSKSKVVIANLAIQYYLSSDVEEYRE